jgi:predicted HTH domain antitoxin
MQKTLSVRMDKEDYEFVKKLAKENKEEISKAVRGLVDLGRLMFAIESYKKGNISIGKASNLAGVSISKMINILSGFGIESNLEHKDYLEGLENLKKVW